MRLHPTRDESLFRGTTLISCYKTALSNH